MEENLDRLQSLVAKSNLVATAGEFVPKTNVGLQQQRCKKFDNVYSTSHYCSDHTNSCNESGNSNLSKPNVALAGSSRDVSCCLNLPNSSGIEVENASSSFTNERSDVFLSGNKEHRHSRPNSGRYNKWKKAEVGDGKKKSDGEHSNIDFQKDSSSKDSNKAKAGHKNHGSRFLCSVKSYEKGGTVYFVNYDNFNASENGSWRKKNKFYDPGRCQTYLPKVKNYGDTGRGNISFANHFMTRNRSELYKNDGRYKFKQYYCDKNGSKEGVNEKIDVCKSKGYNKNSEGFEKTNQRELLIDLLTCGVLECLVCCEQILQNSSVWSCSNCYHVLHLKCTIKWAKSSKSDFGWRCPACQNVTSTVPYEYYCYCGKTKDPEWNHHDCPHSCGEVCGKTHRKSCPHKCMLLCHPGPCPQCSATVTKACGCQRTTKTIQCCSDDVVVCSNVCGKELNCLIHLCPRKCHVDSCEECQQLVGQDCFCGKEHRNVKCTIEAIGVQNFVCGGICKKKLSCENHFCDLICHKGECPRCELTPDLVKFCPCGKTELISLKTEERRSCTDPVPTCNLICGKTLRCSQPGNPHICQSKCHEGSCPVCPLEVMVKCRCGHMNKMVSCSELDAGANNIRCDKRCSKKRSCGKHKCNQLCCTGVDHECLLPCNRLLQCGLHRCEETCHRGHCKPCLRASFEELSCECGAQVIFPPVPCGTRRPPCDRPCTRTHNCDHPPTHSCHSENQCPPCTVLTKKYCHGRHELRKAVPCYQESFSCGLPCGKEIECGRHKCILSCHSGTCLKDGQSCLQPCPVLRPVCGHICGAPCHDGPCPVDIPCKEMVRVTCDCGHRYTTRACHDNASEYQRIATAKLASKMADLRAGQSIELNDVVRASKKLSYKTLECNDECKLIERNRRLAIALQIRNPDLSAKLTPRYSEYLKNWAKKDPRFCQMIHDKLTNLVQLAKQSKQKSRSFSFDPMNREKRHFIHEYCEHFGCESVAYDQEPKRNVVATALKDKSWLPSMSIIEFLQKENSPRKVPAPVIVKTMTPISQRTMEILPSKILSNHQADQGLQEGSSGTNNESQIDYFDWTSQNS